MEMTTKTLREICREHDDLYRTPELNDKLYCNFKGFGSITPALGAYRNLKALFLQGNGLTSIREMPLLPQLKCLFLQQNLLTDLEGLESLPLLDTLDVSDNRLESLTHLEGVSNLTTLIATGNDFKTQKDIENVLSCPSLLTFDLQNNRLDDPNVLDVFEKCLELRCLYLKGNDVVFKIRSYRKTVVSRLRNLTYLDERPVFEMERRLMTAWKDGGLEAERAEREKIQQDEREKERKNFEYLQKIRRNGWKKRREAMGLPPGDTDPYLDGLSSDLSSDDEAESQDLVEARERLEKQTLQQIDDDGVIYLDSIRENAKELIQERKSVVSDLFENVETDPFSVDRQITKIERNETALNF